MGFRPRKRYRGAVSIGSCVLRLLLFKGTQPGFPF
jgi:hypothetical protein